MRCGRRSDLYEVMAGAGGRSFYGSGSCAACLHLTLSEPNENKCDSGHKSWDAELSEVPLEGGVREKTGKPEA